MGGLVVAQANATAPTQMRIVMSIIRRVIVRELSIDCYLVYCTGSPIHIEVIGPALISLTIQLRIYVYVIQIINIQRLIRCTPLNHVALTLNSHRPFSFLLAGVPVRTA